MSFQPILVKLPSSFLLLLLICMHVASANGGMSCPLFPTNLVGELLNSCPIVGQSSDKSFCCYGPDSKAYCCDAEDFARTSGLNIIIPVVLGVLAVGSVITCIAFCLCCSCCPWYRRRRQGAVYGKVHTPNAVHVIPNSTGVVPPVHVAQAMQNTYSPPPYSQNPTGPSQQMPSYPNVAYPQQAPYNPNYIQ